MSFRTPALWFARLICVTAVSGTVYLATLSTTVLDRHDVKEWLGASGLYEDGALISAITAQQPETSLPTTTAITTEQDLITNTAIKNALSRTFPTPFLEQSFNSVIDTSYDWMEGKRADFSFSVPVNSRREIFIAELIKEVEPRVASLQLCSFTARTLCRPDVPVTDFTRQLVTDSLAASDFLQTPITEAAFSSAASSSEVASLSEFPTLRWTVGLLLWILPLIGVAALLGAWLLTERGHKLALGSKVSRAVFSSMTLAVIASGAIIIIEKIYGFPIASALPQVGALAPIMTKFITELILGFSWTLLLYASIPLVVSLIGWITFAQIKKRRTPPTAPLPDIPSPQPPTSPSLAA